MSFKIFSLQLFGKIKPVEKTELQRHSLHENYVEYLKVESSEELSAFLELEKFVQSDHFKKQKEKINGLTFKGSKEYNQLKEFEKLTHSKPIKNYFKIKDSDDLKRYQTLKDSDRIKEFRKLQDFMEKGEFKKEKEKISRDGFKGSVEEKNLREYNKLKKLPGIKAYDELHGSVKLESHNAFYGSEKLKKYFELNNLPDKDKHKNNELKILKKDQEISDYLKFEHSKKLKLYHETVDSYSLKHYKELKAIVESEEFQKRVDYLKDKKKFEKTEAYQNWSRFKEYKGNNDIKFFLKYEKSMLLKNYYDVKDSMELKRFNELKETVSSDEFRERKEYLEDKKKWEKSEEYAKEKKYQEMKQLPRMVNYFKYRGTNTFEFFEKWEKSFEDEFSSTQLDSEKWSTLALWAEKLVGSNYAKPGDLNVFTSNGNIRTGGKLVLETRKESADGLIWKMPAGFVPAKFDYTSGLVSSAKSFWQTDGIFEAKIKFEPVKEVVSSVVLQGENSSDRIFLFEMGTKNRLGTSKSENDRLTVNGLDISNLKKGKWYIFSLEKTGKKLTWKINDTLVLELEQNQLGFPLHINISNLVTDQIPGSKLPAQFQLDWVRCYKRKQSN